jgi:hypothetical protein
MFYEEPGNFMPTDKKHMGGKYGCGKRRESMGIFVHAYKESPVQNLKIVNCTIRGVKTPLKVDYVKNFQMHNVMINGSAATVPPEPVKN